MQKRRAFVFSLLALVLMVGIPGGVLFRAYQREHAGRELILAIKANDTNKALGALDAQADPNFRDPGDATPSLSHFLSTLWQQMRGIKPSPSHVGNSALGLAVEQNNTLLVEALLARGARNTGEPLRIGKGDIDLSYLLLEFAASKHNIAIVQALVKHGWDVNAVDQSKYTALTYARDAATVRALIACGANVNARSSDGYTFLDAELLWWPQEDVINALLAGGACDSKALTAAVCSSNTKALKKMLRLGWKVNMADEDGLSPLMDALDSKERGLAAAVPLIWMGANVNFRDKQGNTPLLLAADGGEQNEMEANMNPESPKIVQAILERGARVDVQNTEGKTPLMIAAYYLRPPLVRLLLQHGARVNLHSKHGKTALSMASRTISLDGERTQDRSEVIRLLKRAGATE